MLTWNQYKKLNENRNLSESVVQQKYQVYLSQIHLNEYFASITGGGGIDDDTVNEFVANDYVENYFI